MFRWTQQSHAILAEAKVTRARQVNSKNQLLVSGSLFSLMPCPTSHWVPRKGQRKRQAIELLAGSMVALAVAPLARFCSLVTWWLVFSTRGS